MAKEQALIAGKLKKTDACYDRGIPFFGENGFLNDGRSLTQNRREKRLMCHFFFMILVGYLVVVL